MINRTVDIKQQKIDAAVAVVLEEATRALDGSSHQIRAGYVEADTVATVLEERGVLVRQAATGYHKEEQARKRIIGQAKRLLDEEADRPEARILRLASRDHARIPCLDGRGRSPYGNTVYYTTPDLFRRATEAVSAARAAQQTLREDMAALRDRARAADIPEPSSESEVSVTYGYDAYRILVETIEHLKSEIRHLVTGEEDS